MSRAQIEKAIDQIEEQGHEPPVNTGEPPVNTGENTWKVDVRELVTLVSRKMRDIAREVPTEDMDGLHGTRLDIVYNELIDVLVEELGLG